MQQTKLSQRVLSNYRRWSNSYHWFLCTTCATGSAASFRRLSKSLFSSLSTRMRSNIWSYASTTTTNATYLPNTMHSRSMPSWMQYFTKNATTYFLSTALSARILSPRMSFISATNASSITKFMPYPLPSSSMSSRLPYYTNASTSTTNLPSALSLSFLSRRMPSNG